MVLDRAATLKVVKMLLILWVKVLILKEEVMLLIVQDRESMLKDMDITSVLQVAVILSLIFLMVDTSVDMA